LALASYEVLQTTSAGQMQHIIFQKLILQERLVICIRIVRTEGTEEDKIRQQISYLEQIQAIASVLLNLQSTFLKVFNELESY